MSSTLTRPAPGGVRDAVAVPRRRTRIFALPEARWVDEVVALMLTRYRTGS